MNSRPTSFQAVLHPQRRKLNLQTLFLPLLVFLLAAEFSTGSVDEYMSCDRYFEEKRTARVLDQIPCDMTKTSYCQLKGSSYPEAAIWRFKEENRALMRRLYGDLESNSVYREMRSTSSNSNAESDEELGVFSSMEYNIRMGSGLATVKSAIEPVIDPVAAEHLVSGQTRLVVKKKRKQQQPHSLAEEPAAAMAASNHSATAAATTSSLEVSSTPTSPATTTAATTTHVTPAPANATEQPLLSSAAGLSSSTTETLNSTEAALTSTTTTTVNLTTTDATVVATSTEAMFVVANETTADPTLTAGGNLTLNTTEAFVLSETSVSDDDFLTTTTNPAFETDDNEDEDYLLLASFLQQLNESLVPPTTQQPPAEGEESILNFPTLAAKEEEVPAESKEGGESQLVPLQEDLELEELEQVIVGQMSSHSNATAATEKTKPEEHNLAAGAANGEKPPTTHHPSAHETSSVEDFGDADDVLTDDEIDDPVDYSGPSINACPVKEEVFAPYWANNTRDQVMALLNLYPFEQYIHMETCKFAEEEMMCRRGCRCEQQYRLHRLLAFDPNNECRGIFSDWFRFPSYCVCKCYHFPEDFVPRQRRKPKLDVSRPRETKAVETKAVETKAVEEAKAVDHGKHQNIPAILPYEARQALLRDMDRSHRTLDERPTADAYPEGRDAAAAAGSDHFLYGNAPVMEYALPDGSSGSVRKVPRK